MKIYFTVLIMFISFVSFSQQTCGTDEMHQKLYMGFPGIHKKVIQNNKTLEEFTKNYLSANNKRKTATYIIPVVFHVIHNYGVENITSNQIYDQLRIINEDFQKLNADTINIVFAFDSISADCEIEFRIAQLDPNGNCTSGITRTQDLETYTGDHEVKSIIHWSPEKYLNIYICANAAGLAGHALVPSAADTISVWDGIVIQHSSVGSIGTSNQMRSVVLTHEIGHYFNLQHTWGGNNVPNYPYLPCADAGNCAYDDGVADTPNTIGWQLCNLSASSCGSLDNVQNFMEYAYCPAMFTNGQKLRMHACLNSSIANRNNLWTGANLIATGTDGVDIFCSVDFTLNKEYVCEGESVQFFDASYHGITSRFWEFEGGIPSTSTDTNPVITYNTAGRYKVKLISGNSIASDSIIKDSLIEVFPSISSKTFLIEDWEWLSDMEDSYWYVNNFDNQESWKLANFGYLSSSSIYMSNLNNSSQQIDEFVSKPIDLSGISNLELTFKYAYAKTDNSNTDKLKILVSPDCGETWSVRKVMYSSQLNTYSDTIGTEFFPSSSLEWDSISVATIPSSFWTSDFMIKFQFESGGGNNIYIDKINLLDPADVGLESFTNDIFEVFPNPVKSSLNIISKTKIRPSKIQIYNSSGSLVFDMPFNNNINISKIAKGVYTILIILEDKQVVRKKIIII